MRQFDVLENPNPASRRHAPFVAVLQSHHLDPLDTIVLAPLVRDVARSVSLIDVPLEFRGEPLVRVVAELAGVRREGLGRVLGSIGEHEDAFRRSLDRLLTGF